MRGIFAATLLALMPWPVLAQGPESLDQLEPDGGEVQVEWRGDFGGVGEQGFELLFGLSDRLAIGAELEVEGPRDGLEIEEISAVLLYRFADPDNAPVGFGVMGEVALDRRGRVMGVEARAIAEVRNDRWWLQGNAMLRHARDDGENGNGIGWSAAVQRNVGGIWLGIEGSGQALRLNGNPDIVPQGSFYAGPSLTVERDIGSDGEIEIGLAWLRRLRGGGTPSGPRIFVQIGF